MAGNDERLYGFISLLCSNHNNLGYFTNTNELNLLLTDSLSLSSIFYISRWMISTDNRELNLDFLI